MMLGGPISSADDMPLPFKHFWLLAVLVNVVNGAIWWYRGKSHRERDPSLAGGYRSLIAGFVGWGSIPWFVMGAGIIFGGVRSVFSYFDLRSPSPFVWAFFASLGMLWAGSTYWLVFGGGAEKLVSHPGFLRGTPTARFVKLCWLASIIPAIVALIAIAFGFVQLPPGF